VVSSKVGVAKVPSVPITYGDRDAS
jgi:hypothetical protein